MVDAVRGKNPLGYLGTPAPLPADVIVENRDPNGQDTNFEIGTNWVNTSADNVFILTNIVPVTGAKWIQLD